MAVKKCLVIGDINIDLEIHASLFPAEGKRNHVENADLRLGGSGCLTAVCLHLMGLPTALAANMGEDRFSFLVKKYLFDSGLDTALVKVIKDEKTGFFMTLITPGGHQTVLGNRGANTEPMQAEKILPLLGEFSHLHVSGYALIGSDQYAVVKKIIEQAASQGISISLDPGVCTSEEAAEKVLRLLNYVNYFLPNQHELASLVKAGSDDEKINILLGKGCKAIVLKKGNLGAKYFERGFTLEVHATKIEGDKVLNTTGAGDCFNAGFLFGILNGKGLEIALELANTAAFKMIASPHGILDMLHEASQK